MAAAVASRAPTYHSSCPPDHESPTEQQQTRTETHLIHLSKTIIHLLNNRLYSHPFFPAHVRQNVYTSVQGRGTIGLHPFLENHRRDAKGSAAFWVDVEFNATAMVDEEAGTGTVILSQYMSGSGGDMSGMNTAGTILFSWQKSKGRWWCGGASMILGTPEFLV